MAPLRAQLRDAAFGVGLRLVEGWLGVSDQLLSVDLFRPQVLVQLEPGVDLVGRELANLLLALRPKLELLVQCVNAVAVLLRVALARLIERGRCRFALMTLLIEGGEVVLRLRQLRAVLGELLRRSGDGRRHRPACGSARSASRAGLHRRQLVRAVERSRADSRDAQAQRRGGGRRQSGPRQ